MVMAKTKKIIKETVAKGKTLLKKKTTSIAKKTASVTASKTTKAAKKAEDTIKTSKEICIDYPSSNDTIFCGHYCFRLGSIKDVPYMRISINGGPWQDCRRANGYWWFDWWNFQTGSFTAEAVSELEGKQIKTAKRKFKVTL